MEGFAATHSDDWSVLDTIDLPICISDIRRADAPLVYANAAFLKLTGYDLQEVLGRNCRFLQGPASDPVAVQRLREAIRLQQSCAVLLANYRKDGTLFYNALQMGPIGEERPARFYFGCQSDVTSTVMERREMERLAAHEVRHRMKNIVSVFSVLLRHEHRAAGVPSSVSEHLIAQLDAVNAASVVSFETGGDKVWLEDLISKIVQPYASSAGGTLSLSGPAVEVPSAGTTPLALALHELVTNATKHGAYSVPGGRVDVEWDTDGPQITVTWTESGGPPVTAPDDLSGAGIVARLLAAAGGSLTHDWRPGGVQATLVLDQPRLER